MRPGATTTCVTRRCDLLASTRGGPHATAGWTVASAAAMHGSRIPHSSSSSIWHLVQAAEVSRRLDVPSTARWRSPVWWNAHHASPRERDESPHAQTRPPVSMTICRLSCRRGRVRAFPSQAFVLSRHERHATQVPSRARTQQPLSWISLYTRTIELQHSLYRSRDARRVKFRSSVGASTTCANVATILFPTFAAGFVGVREICANLQPS